MLRKSNFLVDVLYDNECFAHSSERTQRIDFNLQSYLCGHIASLMPKIIFSQLQVVAAAKENGKYQLKNKQKANGSFKIYCIKEENMFRYPYLHSLTASPAYRLPRCEVCEGVSSLMVLHRHYGKIFKTVEEKRSVNDFTAIALSSCKKLHKL